MRLGTSIVFLSRMSPSVHHAIVTSTTPQIEAGAKSKNGTFVKGKRVDNAEGVALKDGDVVGLGTPLEDGVFNPYNLVVDGVDAFLAWSRGIAGVSGAGGEEQGQAIVKREEGQPMDVDRGGEMVVDLTLDSSSDMSSPRRPSSAQLPSSIVLTDTPPIWYRQDEDYQIYDRKLIPRTRVQLAGQLGYEEIKLHKIPREFLLDVRTQGLVHGLVVRNRINSCKKAWLAGANEVCRCFVVILSLFCRACGRCCRCPPG